MSQEPTFIFIDSSYFCFYRYHSMLNWWKMAHATNPLQEDPIDNQDFVEKYKKTFVDHVSAIPKKLGLHGINPIMILARDCPRASIWRTPLLPDYKGTRNYTDFKGGPFFALTYQEQLFQQGGVQAELHHPNLEADDCIAISVKYVLEKYSNCAIYIITSDKDYLQLIEPRVKIFNLAYKNLAEQKSSMGSPSADLFCKIVMGDPSDNIKSVLSKCGPKKAMKCFQDPLYFEQCLDAENAHEKLKLNKTLVDFNCIPQELITEFMTEKMVYWM